VRKYSVPASSDIALGSGYPKLAISNGFIFVAWTEPGEVGRIQSEWISYNE